MTNWLIEKDYINDIRKKFLKFQSEKKNIHEYMKLLFILEIQRNYEEILSYVAIPHLAGLFASSLITFPLAWMTCVAIPHLAGLFATMKKSFKEV